MTEEIICRYKFHNNEKFNGKEYCTLFNEVCSDVEFVCDKNCQVYEDYKQLKRLEQENKELKEWKTKVVKLFESACRCKYLNEETDICSYTNEKCMNINKCVYKYQNLSDTYRSALEEINITVKQLLQGVSSNCINNTPYLTAFSLIENKINEVLNAES